MGEQQKRARREQRDASMGKLAHFRGGTQLAGGQHWSKGGRTAGSCCLRVGQCARLRYTLRASQGGQPGQHSGGPMDQPRSMQQRRAAPQMPAVCAGCSTDRGGSCSLEILPAAESAALPPCCWAPADQLPLLPSCAVQVKGNVYKNKRVLMEAIHKQKAEKIREKVRGLGSNKQYQSVGGDAGSHGWGVMSAGSLGRRHVGTGKEGMLCACVAGLARSFGRCSRLPAQCNEMQQTSRRSCC